MYEHFTDRARKVMQFASQEAQRFQHEYIGTEHILLGLVEEGSGMAADVFKNLNLDVGKIRLEVERVVQAGPDRATMGELPLTPRARNVISYAVEEARYLDHRHAGTEHLLLGLLREQEGVAAQVLIRLGLTPSMVRQQLSDEKEIEIFLPRCLGVVQERTEDLSHLPDDVRQTLAELAVQQAAWLRDKADTLRKKQNNIIAKYEAKGQVEGDAKGDATGEKA